MADRLDSGPIESEVETDMSRLDLSAQTTQEELSIAANAPPSIHEPDPQSTQTRLQTSSPYSSAATFLASLPTIKHNDLPEHSQICHICKDPFFNNDQTPEAIEDENIDIPLKLPCNHIMGSACLKLWLAASNSNDQKNTSCPMCRATLFHQPPNTNQQAPSIPNPFSHLSHAEVEYLVQRGAQNIRNVEALDANAEALERLGTERRETVDRLAELQALPETSKIREEARRLARILERIEEGRENVQGRISDLRERLAGLSIEGLRMMGQRIRNSNRELSEGERS